MFDHPTVHESTKERLTLDVKVIYIIVNESSQQIPGMMSWALSDQLF